MLPKSVRISSSLLPFLAFCAFVNLVLISCNTDAPEGDSVLKIHNPAPFSSDIEKAKVVLIQDGKAFTLFDGSKSDAHFSGPWSLSLPHPQESAVFDLNLFGYGADAALRMKLSVRYRLVGGKLLADSTLQFYQDTVKVALKDSTFELKWLALPASVTPTVEIAQTGLATLAQAKTLKLRAVGNTQVIARLPNSIFADTQVVMVYADSSGKKNDSIPVKSQPVSPDSLRLFRDSLSLFLGLDEYPITWTAYPKVFQDSVSCLSTVPEIAAMKNTRAMAPIAIGEARIICSIENSKVADTLVVAIKNVSNPTTPLDSIRLALDSVTLYTDKPGTQLEFFTFPATQQLEVMWSVYPAIAKVSAVGLIEPLVPGNGWVTVIGIGSRLVKDSILVRVVDTTSKPIQWMKDTLLVKIQEGQSAQMRLADSLVNPSGQAIEFIQSGTNPKFVLQAGVLTFAAGVKDSGDHYQSVSARQGGKVSSVVIHVRVAPTYVKLKLTATNGSITAIPDQAAYRYGEKVTLIPAPKQGYIFSQWSEDASGTANPLELTFIADKAVTAVFTPGSVGSCTEVLNGASLNQAIVKAYQPGQNVVTLCPAPGGLFDGKTLQVLGKVQILISK